MKLDESILDVICCPIGKSPLKISGDFLECIKCGVRFPVHDGIPSLVADEAVLPPGINSIGELKCMKEQIK